MIRQLVVAVDGSPGRDRLVGHGATLAGTLDAGLLLYGVDPASTDRGEQERALHELLARHADGRGAYMVSGHEHDPLDGILCHTERHPGTLIVSLSHGKGDIGEAAMGSIAAKLLERASAPVLMIGPKVEPSWSLASTVAVLACVDGSDRSERALPTAARFARVSGLSLAILQAVAPDDELFDHDRAERYVAALAQAQRPAATAHVALAPFGAAAAICDASRQLGSPVVAVASRGRGRHGRATAGERPGSVTNDVIRESPAPTLVIPQALHASGTATNPW